jgi:effector-binding domain-containing protein
MKQITLSIFVLTVLLTSQQILAMERKKVEKTNVLMYSLTSTLKTIADDCGQVSMDIEAKAKELGLEITGPQIWSYHGVDGNPNTRFKLDICLPVKEIKGEPGIFKFTQLPEINCLSEIHKGPWNQLSNTYMRMFGEMSRKGMVANGANREIYLNCDFEDEGNNLTEIQIEIQ